MLQNQPIRPKTRTKSRFIALFRTAPSMLFSPKVPWKLKILFVAAVVLYWVLPDVLPFMPVDDVFFTLIVIPWFSQRAAKYDTDPPSLSG